MSGPKFGDLSALNVDQLLAFTAIDPGTKTPGRPDALGELLAELADELSDAGANAYNAAAIGQDGFTPSWGRLFESLARKVAVLQELRCREIAATSPRTSPNGGA